MADVAALEFKDCLPKGSGLKKPFNLRVAAGAVSAVYGLSPKAARALALAAAGIGKASGRIFREGVDLRQGHPDVVANALLLGLESPLDGPTIAHVERQARALWGLDPAHTPWKSSLARRGWSGKTRLASLFSHELAALELFVHGQAAPRLVVLRRFVSRLSPADSATTLSRWLAKGVAANGGAALLIDDDPAPHLALRGSAIEPKAEETIDEVHCFRDGELTLSGPLSALREKWLVASASFDGAVPESLGAEWRGALAWFGDGEARALVERGRRDAAEARLAGLSGARSEIRELRLADLGFFCGPSAPWRQSGWT